MNDDLGFLGIKEGKHEPVPAIGTGSCKTAETTTLVRSGENLKPAETRLFSDPYAIRFVRPELLAWFTTHPTELQEIVRVEERRFPGMNSAIVARTRYFDDIIGESLNNGLEQLVIVGAGFDARAHRIPGLSGNVRIFELDQLETQAVKQAKVREIFGQIPNHVTYVPADLRTSTWQQDLVRNGYDPVKKPSLLWRGSACICHRIP